DVIVEPLIVSAWRVVHYVLHRIQPAGFPRVRVARVHLAFVALRGPTALLELRVKIDAGVGSRGGHDLGPEFEIPKTRAAVGADIVQVRPSATHLERTVGNGEHAGRLLVGAPAAEVAAIEHRYPA